MIFSPDTQKVLEKNIWPLDIYGGSGGAETILTSKYSGSRSIVAIIAGFWTSWGPTIIFFRKEAFKLNPVTLDQTS